MSLETHAIIWFKNEYTKDGRKVIDLVPYSWLVQLSNKNFCYYPPKSQTRMVSEWSKELKEPSLKWNTIEVEIIKLAYNYEQGERRLSRYENTLYIQSSTETHNDSDHYEDYENKFRNLRKYKPTSNNVPNRTTDAPYNTILRKDDNLNISSSNEEDDEECVDDPLNFETETSNKNNKHGAEQPLIAQELITIQMTNLQLILNEQKRSIIQAVENIVKKEISSARNSILYSVRKGFEEMKTKMAVRSVTGHSEVELQTELGFDKPFDTYEAFVIFDSGLKDDTLNETMKDYISILGQGSKDVCDAIKRILPRFICKAVQMKYSGCGRKSGDQRKASFAETKTYEILKDTLKQLFPNISEKEVLTKVSRWLSGAPDREGGRKERASTTTT